MKISSLALSKITSSLQITVDGAQQKVNLGLCLKYDSKSRKVLGYSRKTPKGWEYSQKALDLINEYRVFPFLN